MDHSQYDDADREEEPCVEGRRRLDLFRDTCEAIENGITQSEAFSNVKPGVE